MRTTTTTVSLFAAASLAVAGMGLSALTGCQKDRYSSDYRSGDVGYQTSGRANTLNTGSGGTGSGSPMGDAMGRTPSGSPSLSGGRVGGSGGGPNGDTGTSAGTAGVGATGATDVG